MAAAPPIAEQDQAAAQQGQGAEETEEQQQQRAEDSRIQLRRSLWQQMRGQRAPRTVTASLSEHLELGDEIELGDEMWPQPASLQEMEEAGLRKCWAEQDAAEQAEQAKGADGSARQRAAGRDDETDGEVDW